MATTNTAEPRDMSQIQLETEMVKLDLLKADLYTKQLQLRRDFVRMQNQLLRHIQEIHEAKELDELMRHNFLEQALRVMEDEFLI
jgi:uncharacterized membrane protein YgaE (UPF0421/DUF939 family)